MKVIRRLSLKPKKSKEVPSYVFRSNQITVGWDPNSLCYTISFLQHLRFCNLNHKYSNTCFICNKKLLEGKFHLFVQRITCNLVLINAGCWLFAISSAPVQSVWERKMIHTQSLAVMSNSLLPHKNHTNSEHTVGCQSTIPY